MTATISVTEELAVIPLAAASDSLLVSIPVKELDDEELIAIWSVMDILEKTIVKDRKSEIREEMFERATKQGEENEKGSFIWKLPDGKVTKQCVKKKSVIEPALVKAKLEKQISDMVLTATVTMPLALFEMMREAFDGIFGDDPDAECKSILEILKSPKISANSTVLDGLVAASYITKKDAESVKTSPDPTWKLAVIKPTAMKKAQAGIKARLKEKG